MQKLDVDCYAFLFWLLFLLGLGFSDEKVVVCL